MLDVAYEEASDRRILSHVEWNRQFLLEVSISASFHNKDNAFYNTSSTPLPTSPLDQRGKEKLGVVPYRSRGSQLFFRYMYSIGATDPEIAVEAMKWKFIKVSLTYYRLGICYVLKRMHELTSPNAPTTMPTM